MNNLLEKLEKYPFEKLRALLDPLTPAANSQISLSVGEPQHQSPLFVLEEFYKHIQNINKYPTTAGIVQLRESIATWCQRRYSCSVSIDNVLPVCGSREALFSFIQACFNSVDNKKPLIVTQNPFYQIYEGAGILARAQMYYVNCAANGLPDWHAVENEVWEKTQILIICSPHNPTGAAYTKEQLQFLLDTAMHYNFIIISDECYSEIYRDEARRPVGMLQITDNASLQHVAVFNSLSKRSNLPGLRSGFVASHVDIIKKYLIYRTYHGSALSLPVQYASIAAWNDEKHVVQNRVFYNHKFTEFIGILNAANINIALPDASFYLYLNVGNGEDFATNLYAQQNVIVLPATYLSRVTEDYNPGLQYVRIALVASIDDCIQSAHRIVKLLTNQ